MGCITAQPTTTDYADTDGEEDIELTSRRKRHVVRMTSHTLDPSTGVLSSNDTAIMNYIGITMPAQRSARTPMSMDGVPRKLSLSSMTELCRNKIIRRVSKPRARKLTRFPEPDNQTGNQEAAAATPQSQHALHVHAHTQTHSSKHMTKPSLAPIKRVSNHYKSSTSDGSNLEIMDNDDASSCGDFESITKLTVASTYVADIEPHMAALAVGNEHSRSVSTDNLCHGQHMSHAHHMFSKRSTLVSQYAGIKNPFYHSDDEEDDEDDIDDIDDIDDDARHEDNNDDVDHNAHRDLQQDAESDSSYYHNSEWTASQSHSKLYHHLPRHHNVAAGKKMYSRPPPGKAHKQFVPHHIGDKIKATVTYVPQGRRSILSSHNSLRAQVSSSHETRDFGDSPMSAYCDVSAVGSSSTHNYNPFRAGGAFAMPPMALTNNTSTMTHFSRVAAGRMDSDREAEDSPPPLPAGQRTGYGLRKVGVSPRPHMPPPHNFNHYSRNHQESSDAQGLSNDDQDVEADALSDAGHSHSSTRI